MAVERPALLQREQHAGDGLHDHCGRRENPVGEDDVLVAGDNGAHVAAQIAGEAVKGGAEPRSKQQGGAENMRPFEKRRVKHGYASKAIMTRMLAAIGGFLRIGAKGCSQ